MWLIPQEEIRMFNKRAREKRRRQGDAYKKAEERRRKSNKVKKYQYEYGKKNKVKKYRREYLREWRKRNKQVPL
jgi:hypothetical protein